MYCRSIIKDPRSMSGRSISEANVSDIPLVCRHITTGYYLPNKEQRAQTSRERHDSTMRVWPDAHETFHLPLWTSHLQEALNLQAAKELLEEGEGAAVLYRREAPKGEKLTATRKWEKENSQVYSPRGRYLQISLPCWNENGSGR